MSLPVGDPQFWMASAIVLAALAWIGRRFWGWARTSERSGHCEHCPSHQEPAPKIVAIGRRK